jgi:hypothetical protein
MNFLFCTSLSNENSLTALGELNVGGIQRKISGSAQEGKILED